MNSPYHQRSINLVDEAIAETRRVNPYLSKREEELMLQRQSDLNGNIRNLSKTTMQSSPTNKGEFDRSLEEALATMREWRDELYPAPVSDENETSLNIGNNNYYKQIRFQQMQHHQQQQEKEQEEEQAQTRSNNAPAAVATPTATINNAADQEMRKLATEAIEKIDRLGLKFYKDFRSRYGGNLGLTPSQTAVAYCKYYIATAQGKTPYKKHCYVLSGFGLQQEFVQVSYSPESSSIQLGSM